MGRVLTWTPRANDPGPQGDDKEGCVGSILCGLSLVAALAVLALNEYNRRKLRLAWAPARWEYVAVLLVMVAALVALSWLPAQADIPPVEEPAIPVPASPGSNCDDNPAAIECQPILGPGGCSSDTPWACYAHRVYMPQVQA